VADRGELVHGGGEGGGEEQRELKVLHTTRKEG